MQLYSEGNNYKLFQGDMLDLYGSELVLYLIYI